MEQKAVKDDSLTDWLNYFQYFAAAAFILLLIEVFVTEKSVKQMEALRKNNNHGDTLFSFCEFCHCTIRK